MIEGKKIQLRPLIEEELEIFFKLLAKVRLEFFEKNESFHLFKKQFFEHGFWQENSGLAALLDQKGKLLGSLRYEKPSFYDAYELSFCLFQKEDRGKGFMTEALSLFSSYLFLTRRCNRLQLSIPDYNQAAIAVAKKCGYQFEGILRSAIFWKGKFVDLCLYSLLRKD